MQACESPGTAPTNELTKTKRFSFCCKTKLHVCNKIGAKIKCGRGALKSDLKCKNLFWQVIHRSVYFGCNLYIHNNIDVTTCQIFVFNYHISRPTFSTTTNKLGIFKELEKYCTKHLKPCTKNCLKLQFLNSIQNI